MKIHLINQKATKQQIDEMLEMQNRKFIKLAVDIRQGVLAGGGEFHADCEEVLLRHGCKQNDIWGADWDPYERVVKYEAMLNIAPRRKNPSSKILDPKIRSQVESIVRILLDIT